MVVQYKGATRYICNYLRQQHATPVCQSLPADPIDATVVNAFFEALSPIELDAYNQALTCQAETQKQLAKAREQEIERLRYQAEYAHRQFNKVDPDNRLVAAELERRWEAALCELKEAEDRYLQTLQEEPKQLPLTIAQTETFKAICQRLPEVWNTEVLTQVQRKALLRCLIDKVVLKRLAPDEIQARIVWKGGESTILKVPTTVGSFANLAFAEEMEKTIINLFYEGLDDQSITNKLNKLGYRSPMHKQVLVSTVKTIRMKHRLLRTPSQSHSLKVEGFLTIPQLAQELELTPYWFYDRINNGAIQIDKRSGKLAYVFPDEPSTLQQIQQLKDGSLQKVDFRRGYQDA